MQSSQRRPLRAACLVFIAAAPLYAGGGAGAAEPPTREARNRVTTNDTIALGDEAAFIDDVQPRSAHTPVQERMSLGLPVPLASNADAAGETDIAGVEEERQRTGVLSRLDPRAGDFLQVLAALAAVVGLIVILRTVLVRFGGGLAGGGRPSGVLEVLARYPIARGQQLILLKLGRRIVLAHSSGGSMRALTEVIDRDEVAALLGRIEAGSSGRDAMRFRSLLNRFQQEHDGAGGGEIRSLAAPGCESRDDSEIVDLTRRRGGLFGWGRSAR